MSLPRLLIGPVLSSYFDPKPVDFRPAGGEQEGQGQQRQSRVDLYGVISHEYFA